MSPREPSLYLHAEAESSGTLTDLATKAQEEEIAADREAKVSFGSVIVREYNQVIGDHPEVRVGPPISLGWDYVQSAALSLDDYEKSKPQKRIVRRLTSVTRKNLLHNVFGYSEEEIRSVEKEVQKIQKKRGQTLNQGKAGRVVENAMQAARRKIRKTLLKDSFMQGFSAASNMVAPFPMSMTA